MRISRNLSDLIEHIRELITYSKVRKEFHLRREVKFMRLIALLSDVQEEIQKLNKEGITNEQEIKDRISSIVGDHRFSW